MNEDNGCLADVIELDRTHYKAKNKLGDRVQILRKLIKRYYEPKKSKYSDHDFFAHCEAVLDNVLYRHKYDLEWIIDEWRKIVPALKEHPVVCPTCNFRPVWCHC